MNKVTKAVIALAVCIGFIKGVQAADMTITITPNAFYSVTLDTQTVALDMGSVGLGTSPIVSTQTVTPATATITSTFATTDLQLQGSLPTEWSLDVDSTTVESNSLAVWAVFTDTARSSAPVQGGTYFEGTAPGANSDMVDTNNTYVGTSVADGADIYENESGFDSIDMDGQATSAQSHLWVYFRMPSDSTTTNTQNITLTLTAVAQN